MKIKIKDINVNDRIMKLEEDNVVSIMESIKENGLISPIAIDQDNNLLAGLHRYTACKRLGLDEIECNVIKVVGETDQHKDYTRAMIEIEENLKRKEISSYERARQLKLAFDLERELGQVKTKSDFSKEKSKELGIKESAIFTDLRVAELDNVDPTVLDKAIEHNVNSSIITKLAENKTDQEKNIKIFNEIIEDESERINRYSKDFQNGTVENRLEDEKYIANTLSDRLKEFADKYSLPNSYRVDLTEIENDNAKVEMLLELDKYNFKNQGSFIREAIPQLLRSWKSTSANTNISMLIKKYTDLSEKNTTTVPQDKLDRLNELKSEIIKEEKEKDFKYKNSTIVTKTRYIRMAKKADRYQLYFNVRKENDLEMASNIINSTMLNDVLIVCDSKKIYDNLVGGLK